MANPDLDWFRLVDLKAKPIAPEQIQHKKVKIVCTIGPASESESQIRALIQNGMNVARLNFSHGDLSDHERRIRTLRKAAQLEGVHLGLLQDIQGPKIRVGRFSKKGIELKRGQRFTITTNPIWGDETRVSCTYRNLHKDIKPGHRILVDDGLLFLVVDKVSGRDIHTHVVFGGPIKDNKGMNLPDTHVQISCLTPKDRKDLDFGLKSNVDFVALSFVQSAADVRAARRIVEKSRNRPALVAKIESALAVQDLENILKECDGIMVARGDLGVECPLEQVPALQKQIIRAANRAGKFVITATQMLESMTEKPRPTRAEASDVANAVFDGTDAVMLSAETASGAYPVEAAKTMSRIILRAEEYLESLPVRERQRQIDEPTSVTNAITFAAAQAVRLLKNVDGVVAFTHSGTTAQAISKHRAPLPIFALTPLDRIARRLSVVWGVKPAVIRLMRHTDDMPKLAKPILQEHGLWKAKAKFLFLSGTPVARPGSTNLLKIFEV